MSDRQQRRGDGADGNRRTTNRGTGRYHERASRSDARIGANEARSRRSRDERRAENQANSEVRSTHRQNRSVRPNDRSGGQRSGYLSRGDGGRPIVSQGEGATTRNRRDALQDRISVSSGSGRGDQSGQARQADRESSRRRSSARRAASARPSASNRPSASGRATSSRPSALGLGKASPAASPRVSRRDAVQGRRSVRGASVSTRATGSSAALTTGRPSVSAASKKPQSRMKFVIAAALILVLVGAGAAFAYYQTIENNLHDGLSEDLSQYLVKTDLTNEPFYMLLMGTDGSSEREADDSFGGSFRTDSIILARIDPVNKQASLVSIHRDSEVDMGEYGTQKINAAHFYGGASLSVQTVSKMAGVDISHYAEINFDGFEDIVDALGGVEVEVPTEIDDEDAGGHLDAGLQTLNGEQALILCRSRNTYANAADPDSMRAANQRLVLSAIAKKILSSDIATISNSVTAISKYVTTDLSVSDIIGLAQAMQGMDTETSLYTAMEPVTSEYTNDLWHTYTLQDEWKEMISRMDQGLPPSEEAQVDESTGTITATNGTAIDTSQKSATVSVKNGTSNSARGQAAAEKIKASGFANTTYADANSADYENTLVIYNTASQKTDAEQIVTALGQGKTQLNNNEWLFDTDFLVVIGADWED
jgi:polyisoprenyl-teichoic acid--peptidoglycan teichoic acid transferase